MHFNEFFLGLEHVSALTHMFDAEFRADLTTVDDKSAYAYYRLNFDNCHTINCLFKVLLKTITSTNFSAISKLQTLQTNTD